MLRIKCSMTILLRVMTVNLRLCIQYRVWSHRLCTEAPTSGEIIAPEIDGKLSLWVASISVENMRFMSLKLLLSHGRLCVSVIEGEGTVSGWRRHGVEHRICKWLILLHPHLLVACAYGHYDIDYLSSSLTQSRMIHKSNSLICKLDSFQVEYKKLGLPLRL